MNTNELNGMQSITGNGHLPVGICANACARIERYLEVLFDAVADNRELAKRHRVRGDRLSTVKALNAVREGEVDVAASHRRAERVGLEVLESLKRIEAKLHVAGLQVVRP